MNRLLPKQKWYDDWIPEWNPGYLIRPLHGDALPSQIRLDIAETDDAFHVKAELPGVSKNDIDVSIKGSVVSLSAEVKQEDRKTEDGRVLRSERYYGKLTRSFELPSAIDIEACDASYEEGVLTLILKKTNNTVDQHKVNVR